MKNALNFYEMFDSYRNNNNFFVVPNGLDEKPNYK